MLTRWCVSLLSLSLLFVLAANAFAGDERIDNLSYGKLIAVEYRSPVSGRFDVSLRSGFGLGTPQYVLYSVMPDVSYWIGNYFVAGVRGEFHFVSPTELERVLEAQLVLASTTIKYSHPERTFTGRLGVAPLQGLINLFGYHVLSYQMILGAGFGTTHFSDNNNAFSTQLFVEQRMEIYKNTGIVLGYNYMIEQPGGRSMVETGLYVRF